MTPWREESPLDCSLSEERAGDVIRMCVITHEECGWTHCWDVSRRSELSATMKHGD